MKRYFFPILCLFLLIGCQRGANTDYFAYRNAPFETEGFFREEGKAPIPFSLSGTCEEMLLTLKGGTMEGAVYRYSDGEITLETEGAVIPVVSSVPFETVFEAFTVSRDALIGVTENGENTCLAFPDFTLTLDGELLPCRIQNDTCDFSLTDFHFSVAPDE